MDGINLALLQEERRVVVPYLARIFCAWLVNGYNPVIWHQVKVLFIPKPGRNSFCGPRDTTGHNSWLLLPFLLTITP
jgi:hypothetical protein